MLLNGYRVSVSGDEKFWKIDVVMVTHVVNVLNATKLYTLNGKLHVKYILLFSH